MHIDRLRWLVRNGTLHTLQDAGELAKGAPAILAEIERLRAGYASIMAATVAGRVCDDVAWFDTITTLYDYCDAMLAGNEHLFAETPVPQQGTQPK